MDLFARAVARYRPAMRLSDSRICGALALLLACGDSGGRGQDSATSGLSGGLGPLTLPTTSGAPTESGGGGEGGDTLGKLDVAAVETEGLPGGGDCVDDDDDGEPGGKFSIIWIANTGEGTVSKIDTETAVELARYRTGPGNPDPSRTSVNLRGDVAVANRAGGVTKIAARVVDCVDKDGNGTIDTSQGPADVRAWGLDECVMWHHPIEFPQGLDSNQGGPRAIAWDAGSLDTCFADAHVWVGWRDQPTSTVNVRRIDGMSGVEDVTVQVPDWDCEWGHGTYGGAADKNGAFWGLGTHLTLVRVDPKNFKVDRFQGPGGRVVYGIAIDKHGDPWLAGWDGGLWRFDVATAQFQDMGGFAGGPQRLRGLTIDANGDAWVAGNDPCALARYDTEAQQVVAASIELPGCGEPVGVSIDRDGFVWVVDRAANRAYKVDPDSYATVIVEGLVAPYTYSDMTGRGLDLVVNPPQG